MLNRGLCLLLAAPLLAACTDADREIVERESVSAVDQTIINGIPDYDHDAVVAIFASEGSGCSGTIIFQLDSDAYVLTAAHCFEKGDIDVIVVGDDFMDESAQTFSVVESQVHPSFNQDDLVFDFAMIRAKAFIPLPVIPALAPGEDMLIPGVEVQHVGYGLTSFPDGQTSQRHQTTGQLDQVGSIQLAYEQPTSGPCQGDSGGPNLVTVNGEERVAGIISFGDEGCDEVGVSGRVSSVYTTFVYQFIGVDPSTPGTTVSASSSAGAGGGSPGAGGAAAAGGAGSGEEWTAGATERVDFVGEPLQSCAASAPALPTGKRVWWLLGLAWLGMFAFRRRAA
jgi:MYXO-CTERM domain-containing protein